MNTMAAQAERQADARPVSAVGEWLSRNRNVLLTFFALIALWEFAAWFFALPPYLLPAPSAILEEFSRRWPPVLSNALTTGNVILLGFLISVFVSVPLSLLFAFSKTLQTTVYPLIVLFQIVPKIAIAPLFIIWFGFGLAPKLLLVFLMSFFPIIVSSIAGFRSIDPEIMDFARSTGATEWKIFRRIRLPAALPNIFVGLKVAAVLAPTAAVVAEFVASDSGLGFLLLQYNGDLDTGMAFATIIVLSAIGLLLYYAVELIERLTIPWHVSQEKDLLETT